MILTLQTYQTWDETLWAQMEPIYEEAFPHGAKPKRILKAILDRQIGFLHAGYEGNELIAMAVTGFGGSPDQHNLIIDYMAIRHDQRGQGKGRIFFNLLRDWGREHYDIHAVIIEAEAEDNEENRERIRFWEHCGFTATDYVHHYIWVPETYRALVLPLQSDYQLTDDGRSLFEQITSFHEQSFRKKA